MKTALFLTTPLLAFLAAAMLAKHASQDNFAARSDQSIASSPSKSARAIEVHPPADTSIESVLAEMEHKALRFTPPGVEIYDADGMESRLLIDLRTSASGGGGVAAVNYSRFWAADNPAEMFEWFIHQELISHDIRKSLVGWIFDQWAQQDMAAALAAVTRISHAETRAQALVSTLEVLCKNDPAKARELLLQNISLLEVLKSVELQVFELGKARFELISVLPRGRLRSLLMAEHVRSLMTQGLGCGGDKSSYYAQTAVGSELWKQLSIEERRELVDAGLRLSFLDEIQLDGLEELIKQQAEASHDPSQAYDFIDRYGSRWAERDLAAALSWTMAHLKGYKRKEWSVILIYSPAEKDFDESMRVWNTLPEGIIREEAAEWLISLAPADREAEKGLLQNAVPKLGKW